MHQRAWSNQDPMRVNYNARSSTLDSKVRNLANRYANIVQANQVQGTQSWRNRKNELNLV